MTGMSGVQRAAGLLTRCAVLLTLAALSIQPAAGMGVYWSPRIEGTIIDAITKTPVEGVIVTASWIQTGITGHGQSTVKVSETVTTANGGYELPAWGPRVYSGTMDRDQPVIRFFKPGYIPLIIDNNSAYHPGLEDDTQHKIKVPATLSDGSAVYWLYEPEEHQVKFGKKKHTFMLEPFKGTDAEYVALLTTDPVSYVDSLSHLTSGQECEWKDIPRTLVALHKLRAALEAKNVFPGAIPYVSGVGNQKHCGDAKEYFKEF
ncbi:MAG TPA: carboxypeptidase regulatory-like domain-containing protein [Gammaproteobacteria bacterium]|nr:carboxypeptidase regulatory-like domain-containing protein [Gammaproteobacteria bacterium]